jgi:hypothetical protein
VPLLKIETVAHEKNPTAIRKRPPKTMIIARRNFRKPIIVIPPFNSSGVYHNNIYGNKRLNTLYCQIRNILAGGKEWVSGEFSSGDFFR